MTAKEAQERAEAMKKLTRKVSGSRSEAIKLLAKAGICTPKGNLKKLYR